MNRHLLCATSWKNLNTVVRLGQSLSNKRYGSFRIRLRSKGPEINELAKQYGGGGHPLASGAVVEDEDHIKDFVKDLNDLVAKNK